MTIDDRLLGPMIKDDRGKAAKAMAASGSVTARALEMASWKSL